MTRHSTALILVVYLLLCLIWGTTWYAIKIGLEGIPPFTGVALRFAVAAVLLLVLARVMGVRLGGKPNERALWLVNGLLAFCISYGVVYWAEQWVPSGLASVLFATYPLFVALIGHFVLPKERLRREELIGILVSFAGVVLIYSEDFGVLGGPQVALASVVMIFSPAAAAMSTVAVKRWGSGIHPFSLTAVPMALTAVVMGLIAVAVERERTLVWDEVSVGALLYLAVFGSALTFTLYYWLLEQLPVQQMSLIAFLIPIVAVLIGVLAGEPFTARLFAGSALVLAGVAVAVYFRAARR